MIEFGTGGWRAEIGKDFTYDNVTIIIKSIVSLAKSQRCQAPIAIGYDNRFLSKEMAEFAGKILRSYGISTIAFTESVPTPLLMFAVKRELLDFGIMITASHNPPTYNGIKLIVRGGLDAPKEITDNLIKSDFSEIDNYAGAVGECSYFDNYQEIYIKENLDFVDWTAIRSMIREHPDKYHIFFNGMNGSGSKLFIDILTKLEIPHQCVSVSQDCYFGGAAPEPSVETTTRFIEAYKSKLSSKGAIPPCLGVVFDGDGDRLMLLDDLGNPLDMNDILCMLYWYLHEFKGMSGGVVLNSCTTSLLKKMATQYGEQYYEVPVGFKWITSKMIETNSLLGGESSGGLAFQGHIYGKDSILASMLVLQMLIDTDMSLSEIKKELDSCNGIIPLRTSAKIDYSKYHKSKESITNIINSITFNNLQNKNNFDGTKFYFEDGLSWISYRFSGTEPILRIMTESFSGQNLETDAINELKNRLLDTRRTCTNCKHYISTIYSDDSFFHMHDFCEIWRREIPDCSNDNFSDVEHGNAVCWCFKTKSEN